LAYVAETERAFIRQRQAEGIAAAKQRGVRFGASKIELGNEFFECCRKWETGEITLKEGADYLGISLSTFYRRCMEEKRKS
jgi:DNA invertase Pin-like site-specific DNA recombinase